MPQAVLSVAALTRNPGISARDYADLCFASRTHIQLMKSRLLTELIAWSQDGRLSPLRAAPESPWEAWPRACR
jgi:hypothetical protein